MLRLIVITLLLVTLAPRIMSLASGHKDDRSVAQQLQENSGSGAGASKGFLTAIKERFTEKAGLGSGSGSRFSYTQVTNYSEHDRSLGVVWNETYPDAPIAGR